METGQVLLLYAIISHLLVVVMMGHCRQCCRLSVGILALDAAIGTCLWVIWRTGPFAYELTPWPCFLLLLAVILILSTQLGLVLELIGFTTDRVFGTSHDRCWKQNDRMADTSRREQPSANSDPFD